MQLSTILPPTAALILTVGVVSPALCDDDEPGTPGTLAAVGVDGVVEELPLRHTDVSIEVTAFVVRTTVEQVFVNPFDHPIEVVYTFPLGHDSAVDRFEMQSGDRVIRGEIHRRAEAREIYEAAQTEGRQAALLEQERPNVFTQSVANLLPAGEVRVRLRTVELAEYDAGRYQLTFPLVVGPRYVPGETLAATGDSASPAHAPDPTADTSRIQPPSLPREVRSGHDVDIRVELDAGVPLRGLSSASHEIEVEQLDPARVRVRLSPADRIPNKDFILRWTVASDEPAVGLLSHRQGVEGYFALLVQPRGFVAAEQAAPKEILFVLDTSGSMSGAPLRMSKAFIHDALRSLGSRDTFNLIRFSDHSATYSGRSEDGTPGNVEDALAWVDKLRGGGGTEMLDGLERAVGHERDAQRYRMIVFLTDGYIGNENQILGRVKELPADVRIFTVGIGSSVNHALLDGMARLGGGAYTFIPNDADAPAALERFTDWVTRPYLTDLEIDWGHLPVGDWIPEIPRDLFSGENLAVVGRYFGAAEGRVVLRGRLGGEHWEQELAVTLPDEEPKHAALASVWARNRIEALLDESPQGASRRVREEITELALEYGLMSPFTSFVAVDYQVVNPGGPSESIRQPVPLPDGTTFEGEVSSGITVRVVDPEGLPLPGATVTIGPESGSAAARTTELTDRDGRVDFPVLSPGADYTIQVAFPGFSALRYEDVRVENGKGVLLAVQMIEVLAENVRVAAESPFIDVDKTETSTRFSDEFISDLPVPGRFYGNVLAMTPGVADADGDGLPNVHGSRARDFQTIVGGVSYVDPRTGEWISRINANSIEEMEVITAGAGVEFGRAQGGFARIIQKQGSNTHEGIFRLEAGSDRLDAAGGRDVPFAYEDTRGGFQVSGPIARDRLWYRASHEWIDRDDPVRTGSAIVIAPQRNASHSDQLTWQAAPRSKLALKGLWQNEDQRRVGVSSLVTTESSPRRDLGERLLSLSWTMAYSPRILVETVFSRRDAGFGRLPLGVPAANGCVAVDDALLGDSECLDLVDGVQSGSAYRAWDRDFRRYGLESKATVYGGRKWGMSHQFKLGVDFGLERHDQELTRDPNLTRMPSEDTDVVLARTAADRNTTSGADLRSWALFVEDQTKPHPDLTLTVGLRIDAERVETQGFTPFDPRAELGRFIETSQGLTGDERADLAGELFTSPEDLQAFLDGVSELVGEDRCCADPIVAPGTLVSTRAREPLRLDDTNVSPFLSLKWSPWSHGRTAFSFAIRRYYDKLLPDYALVETEPATADLFVTDPTPPAVRPSIQTVDHGLETPFQDELTLGFEQEIHTEVRFAVSYVHRRFERQIQLFDLNHVAGDFGSCGAGPGGADGIVDDCDLDGLPDLYVQNPWWSDVFLLGNFGSASYEGVTLALDRGQYRSWEMHASYTFSEARGSAEPFDPLVGDERMLLEPRRGFQSYDQRHVFKLNATANTPWGFRIGTSVAWESGLPYSRLEQRAALDAIPEELAGLATGVPQPRWAYTSTTRNRTRNADFVNVDVRVAKEFSLGLRMRMRCIIEVLNALDDRSYRVYPAERAYGRSIDGFDDATLRYGRRYRLGLEMQF